MWEHGRARGVLKRKRVWKRGESNVKVEVSLRGVCLYAKCFHPSGDLGLDGGAGEKEAGASIGLYLLQLRWIAKLLSWAEYSKRLTNPMTEPVITHEEIGSWVLSEEEIQGE